MAQTVQHIRRLNAPGAPTTLLPGQYALNDSPTSGYQARLYAGGSGNPAGGVWGIFEWGVGQWGAPGAAHIITMVSDTRQVELAGNQTITGEKTFNNINLLKVNGGAAGDFVTTDGNGNLSFIAVGGASSTTSALFTPPAVNSTVQITVDSTSWMGVGAPVAVAGMVYTVQSVDSPTQVTLLRVS